MGTASRLVEGSALQLTADDISLSGFGLEQRCIVQGSVHELHGGILAGDEGALVAVSHQAGEVVVGVGLVESVQGVAAYVACCAGSVRG